MPTYKEIRDILYERLRIGEWKPGDTIPSEQVLAQEFGTTRVTVNRAMRELADTGIIERRRKTGTRVVHRQSREFVIGLSLVRNEIEARGSRYRFSCLERKFGVPPAHITAELKLAPDTEALHVICLHFADDTPYQLEDRWINLSTIPNARDQAFDITNPNEWLVREVPFTDARHILRAQTPSERERELLQLASDEPIFLIERTTWLADASVTSVRLIHPGNRFSLMTQDAGIYKN